MDSSYEMLPTPENASHAISVSPDDSKSPNSNDPSSNDPNFLHNIRSTLRKWKGATALAYKSLGKDFRRVEWRRHRLWPLIVIWTCLLVTGLVPLAFPAGVAILFTSRSACLPDNTFSLSPGEFHIWSSPGFFEVTLGFGNLTFTQAKVIDVIWDITVGRGGQVFLAYIFFYVLREYISYRMQSNPVSFALYKHTFLNSEPSILFTAQLTRELIFRRGLDSKLLMTWIIFSSLVVLSIPTVVSAMTAYATNTKAFLLDRSNNLIDFDLVRRLDYTIHDGSRVNLADNYQVTTAWDSPAFQSVDCTAARQPTDCFLWSNTSRYISMYIDHNINHTGESGFMGYSLTDKLLNITRESTYTGGGTVQIVLKESKYMFENETYLTSEILGPKHLGQCQSTGTYKWGFSFLMLYPFLALLLIWTAGTWLLWIKAHLTLKTEGKPDTGEYKAILRLATAILEQSSADIPDTLSEKELRGKILKEMGGGLVVDGQFRSPWTYPLHQSFFEGNRPWWWLAFSSAIIMIILWTIVVPPLAILYSWMLVGLALALMVGRSDESMLALMAPFVILGLVSIISFSLV